jgi:hypothetical protein
MLVTDIKRIDKNGKEKIGYYMQGYLKKNLDGVPNFLKKEWDVVGIITGHGKVGTGKSTIALQVGYYLAWLLSGGEMLDEEYEKGKFRVVGMVKPKRPVRFGMENIVFTPEDLMKKAETLYNKYGPNQVIVYDEGKSGLDSENAMKSINKAMTEFMQRCRVYHHIILIVLPNFFKLHEDYAVARSLFLIDAYADKEFNRGYFSFYNELQKEKLFYFGKRLIGVRARYAAAHDSFWGKFTKWLPVDKETYDKAKIKAIKNLNMTRHDIKYKKQRDAAIYLTKKYSDLPSESISKELSAICNEKISPRSIRYAISNITKEKSSDIE